MPKHAVFGRFLRMTFFVIGCFILSLNNIFAITIQNCSDGITSDSTSYFPNAPLEAVLYNDEEVIINNNTYYEYNDNSYKLLTGSGTSFNLSHAASAANKEHDDPVYLQYMAEIDYYTRGMEWSVELNGATLHGYSICNAGSNAWTKPFGGVKETPLSGTYNGCSCSLDKQRWVIYGKPENDTSFSGWEAKNTNCRKNCPYLCAYSIATNSSFRQTILNNSCEISEENGENTGGGNSGNNTPYCNENQFIYDNSCINTAFAITTTPYTDYFKFTISAKGTFYVDWGDGVIRRYRNEQPENLVIDHNYSIQHTYTIRIGGIAELYSDVATTPAISFTDFDEATNTASAVAGISGSLAQLFPTIGEGNSLTTQPRFYRTFNQCVNLSGNLPTNLFSDLSGTPVPYMFYATFMGCENITGPIPENFFGNVSGQPAQYMFDGTFSSCYKLGTLDNQPFYSIPENLFENISGESVPHLFPGTFYGCNGLTGSIPKDLFKNIYGNPQPRLFAATFEGCSNLTGSIPPELFRNFSGSLVDKSFRTTFKGTASLESFIPPELFENMDNNNHTGDGMSGIFEGSGVATQCGERYYQVESEFSQYWDGHVSCAECPAGQITDYNNKIGIQACHDKTYTCYSGEYLYVDDNIVECRICPVGYYCPNGTWTTGTADQSKILCPDGKFSVEGTMDEYGCIEPAFEIDIKAHTNPFVFRVAAKGYLLIDWGDNTIEKITMDTANPQRIQHYYSADDHEPHTIKMSGNITEYFTGSDIEIDEDNGFEYSGAITFGMVKNNNETNSYNKITAIRGSLGKIFKTIGNGNSLSTQPRFIKTFNNCDQITSPIPEYIFTDQYDSTKGVHGAPIDYMFYKTFAGCTGITGTLTDNLFKNIAGETANGMFNYTFYNCQNITSTIPPTLFAGIYGSPKEAMYSSTFSGCKKLYGTIPPALFGNIYGAPADNMYSGTFDGCINLEGSIPSGLFGIISGPVKPWMYNATFYNCPKLSGYIPTDLFGELSGNPEWMMFYQTFKGDNQIIGFKNYSNDETYRFIPSYFFGNINNVNYDSSELSMTEMFKETAIYIKCPVGYYFYDTGFTEDISPYVSCLKCDAGTTTLYEGAMSKTECVPVSFECSSNKWLMIGDNDRMCLSYEKPNGTKSLAISLPDKTYFIPLSSNLNLNINAESNKKMYVYYNGTTYSAHDESVQ
ncbi:MAG: hypothetical protein IKZ49_01810 [Alphaproteobacteria bacterium]|nr:hypothetical protein [Alphaproteobacteria bacterium]